MEMKKEYGDDYWGVRYLVTFVGDLVRGDVPELAVVSLGRDGCHDASRPRTPRTSSARTRDGVRPRRGTSTVPVRRAQTTAPLPWDAEADDVKYALEALQQVRTVDVERVVETGSNGYAWYVTFTAELESRDDTRFMFSPLLGLGANEDGLEAAIQPTVTVTAVPRALVPAPSGGGPTYVRVAADGRLRRRRLPHDVAGRPDAADPEAGPAGARARRGRLADGAARGVGRPGERRRRARHVVRGRVRPGADLRLGRAGPRRGLGARVRVETAAAWRTSSVGHGRRDDGRALPGRLLRPQLRRPGHAGAAVRRVGRRRRGGARGALHPSTTSRSRGAMRCSPAPDAATDCVDPQGYTWLVTFDAVQYPGDQHTRSRSLLPGRRGPQALRGRREPPELRDQGGAGQRPARHGLPARRGHVSAVATLTRGAAGGADLHLRRQRRASGGSQNSDSFSLQVRGDYTQTLYLRKPSKLTRRRSNVRVPGRRRGHGPGAAPRPRRRVGPDAAPREGRGGLRAGRRAGVARAEPSAECPLTARARGANVTLPCDECPLTARSTTRAATWLPCSGQNVTVGAEARAATRPSSRRTPADEVASRRSAWAA